MPQPNRYFRPSHELSPLGAGVAAIITSLNLGRGGEHGYVAVRASKRGYAITLNGKPLATGKTGEELQESFNAACEKARQETEKRT